MRIALFSDIHANLPALEAFFKSIDEQQPDAIYCLGDLVGYNIWPNEVINEIRQRRIPTIKGNYDEGIGLMSGDCGCAYKTERDKEMGNISIYLNFLRKQKIGTTQRALESTCQAGWNGMVQAQRVKKIYQTSKNICQVNKKMFIQTFNTFSTL